MRKGGRLCKAKSPSLWEFCTRMIREGRLAAVPGVCFGAEGYIRLSYCYSDEELKAGLDNMEAFLKGL